MASLEERLGKTDEGDQEVQTCSYKLNKSWDVIYSTGNIVNKIVMILYRDRKLLDLPWQSICMSFVPTDYVVHLKLI